MNKHPFRTLIDSFGLEAEIDEEIADLLSEIWKADLYTLNSCQANPDKDWIWIEFDTSSDASTFLHIVNVNHTADEESKSLYRRSVQGIWDNDNSWNYNAFVHNTDTAPEEWEDPDAVAQTCTPEFHISIRFPKTDYPLVLKRMRAWNQAGIVDPLLREKPVESMPKESSS